MDPREMVPLKIGLSVVPKYHNVHGAVGGPWYREFHCLCSAVDTWSIFFRGDPRQVKDQIKGIKLDLLFEEKCFRPPFMRAIILPLVEKFRCQYIRLFS